MGQLYMKNRTIEYKFGITTNCKKKHKPTLQMRQDFAVILARDNIHPHYRYSPTSNDDGATVSLLVPVVTFAFVDDDDDQWSMPSMRTADDALREGWCWYEY